MSDYTDNEDDLDAPDAESANSDGKGWRKQMERERAEAKAEAQRVAEENAKVKKELAFLKAGLDLNGELTPQQKLFVKAYDGDVTPDAVKAAAVEYGVIDAPQAQVPAEELAGHDRFAQAAAGSQVSQADGDVYAAALDKAETAADVIAALQAANPDLVDTSNWNAKFVGGGSAGTPATTPL